MTEVTGFGLLGHSLELARGGGVSLDISYERVPFLEQAEALAEAGYATGASGRNWGSYSDGIILPAELPAWRRTLLTDPQTSGGLLVACAAPRAPSPFAPPSRTLAIRARASSGRLPLAIRSSGLPDAVQCLTTSSTFRRNPRASKNSLSPRIERSCSRCRTRDARRRLASPTNPIRLA